MSAQQQDHRLKQLEEENALLLEQLHVVQIELEQRFLADAAAGNDAANAVNYPTDWLQDLPNAQTEALRLQAINRVQQWVHQQYMDTALNAHIGDVFIEAAGKGGSWLNVPGQLLEIWRRNRSDKAPAALGGDDYTAVINAFEEGGVDAVENLLGAHNVNQVVKANAWTAVARYLRGVNASQAADAARRAFEADAKPFRLKWLAYRTYEAGDVCEAAAMLDVLPEDTPFNDSELRRANGIKGEAQRTWQYQAQQQSQIDTHRHGLNNLIHQLEELRKAHARLLDERNRTVSEQATQLQQQDETITALQAQVEELKSAVTRVREECDALKEKVTRQDAIAVEIARADAQLQLIKEVILHEATP